MATTPKAVLISDIHYNINTLPLADAALRMAVEKANELEIPLIVSGDLHDTKALLRGECIKAILDTLGQCWARPYVISGNHDRINERAPAHSLEFLRSVAHVVDRPLVPYNTSLILVPYYHDKEELEAFLKEPHDIKTLIMHQGVIGSLSGEYTFDKSAISKDWVKDYRVISGHYHTRQDIKTGRPRKGGIGLFSYVGNPYTLTFAEANDPEKGFQVLNTDGSLTFIPTNLRKHIITETTDPVKTYNPGDLVRMRLKGTRAEMRAIDKEALRNSLFGGNDFKLEKTIIEADRPVEAASHSDDQRMDGLIDTLAEDPEIKVQLKKLWREVANEA